jgi:Zn-dependent protease with chaperone function
MPEWTTAAAPPWEPRTPPALESSDYALLEDRRALQRLRTLVPLVAMTRRYLRHMGEPMVRAQLLGGAVQVTERQFPLLHALSVRCARVLHMDPPDVFVIQHPVMNARTYGQERPVVVLHSGLVDAMTERELAFTLGHEFGHVKSEHVLFLNLAEFLRTGATIALQWAAAPAALALFAWQRFAEHTADRAGLITCQRIDDAQSALIKLALGSQRLFEQVNVEEYLRQNGSLDGLPARAVLALQGHPFTARRVLALREYVASPEYTALWSTHRPPASPPEAPSTLERVGQAVVAAATEAGSQGRAAAQTLKGRLQNTLRGGSEAPPLVEAREDEEPV